MADDDVIYRPKDAAGTPSAAAQAPMSVPDEEGVYRAKAANEPERKPQGILTHQPDDSDLANTARNVATGVIKGAAHTPGMGGDIGEFISHVHDMAMARIQGRPAEEIKRERDEARALEDTLRKQGKSQESIVDKALRYGRMLPAGHDISDPVLKQTGEYEPQTTLGKYGQVGLEGAVGAMTPGGGGRLLPTALMGATSTIAGQGAHDLHLAPEVGLLASVVAPMVAGKAIDVTSSHLPAFTKGQRQALADKTLKNMATNPEAIAQHSLENPLPGAKATLGVTTGDEGLLAGEKNRAAVDEQFAIGRTALERKQNQIQVKTINDLANPAANPKDVADHFVRHLDALDEHHAAVVANAEKQAASIAATLPEGQAIDQLGTHLQDVTNPRMKAAREMRSRAYDAVDPDGTMHIVATPAAKAAQKMLTDHDPQFGDLAPVVKTAIDKVAGLREVVPFKGMMQLDTWLNGLIGENRSNSTVLNQLGQLKTAVKGTVRDALENQIRWEQQENAAGRLPKENTIGYRLAQDAQVFKEARRSAGTSSALTGTGPATGVRGAGGGEGASGGPGVRPGAEGVAGDVRPNMDEAAAGRWQGAKDLHADFSDTYRAGIVGKGLETEFGRFTQKGSDVAKKAFVPGDAGGENVRSWLRAGGADAQAVIQDIAVARLREMMKGSDRLTPEILQKWKTDYAPALREMPEFANSFNDAAAATQALGEATVARKAALSDYQKGIAKDFLGLSPEHSAQDVTRAVGDIISDKQGATKTARLMDAVKDNPAALEGVRKATVDWLFGRTANAGILGGENIMSGAKMPKLVRDRESSLRQIFGDEGYANIRNVVDDLERTVEARTLTAEPGSDTTTKMKALTKLNSEAEAAKTSWLHVLMAASGEAATTAYLGFPTLGTITVLGSIGNHFRKKLRAHGIQNAMDLVREGMLKPEVGQAMVQRALAADGKPNMGALATIAAGTMGLSEPSREAEREREGRASGGAVRDPASHAMTLLRDAERIRKQHGTQTEALLKLPDEHVARALAVANEAIHG